MQNKWNIAGGVLLPSFSMVEQMGLGCFGAGWVGDLYKDKGILYKEGYHSSLRPMSYPVEGA